MRYHFREGVAENKKSSRRAWLVVLPVIGLLVGGYILANAFSPALINVPGTEGAKAIERRLSEKPGTHGDRLYIPQINVDVAILEGTDESVLSKGAWHRKPENGNPVTGGNFVLSAHRFVMGVTPQETRMQSPFYNLDKLAIGDQFFVDYEGERYGYKIAEKISVKPDQVEIEEPSEDAKLTLYSCTLGGSADGRDVIVANPLGKIEKLQVSSD